MAQVDQKKCDRCRDGWVRVARPEEGWGLCAHCDGTGLYTPEDDLDLWPDPAPEQRERSGAVVTIVLAAATAALICFGLWAGMKLVRAGSELRHVSAEVVAERVAR